MAPTPVLLPGKSHGQRGLVGCQESDTTEQLYFTDVWDLVGIQYAPECWSHFNKKRGIHLMPGPWALGEEIVPSP